MKFVAMAGALALLAGCAAGGSAGMNADMARSRASQMEAGDSFTAAMNSAQANAARPGDENLTCDQMQTEITTIFNDPSFQASMSSLGAQAQSQYDRSRVPGGAAGAVGMGLAGAAASMIPGGGWLASAAMQAQMASAASQAKASAASTNAMMADTTKIMPQIMRGQRLYDLGTAKTCAFLQGQQ